MSKSGRPSKVTEMDVLEFYKRQERPHVTAKHVADEFNCSRETARRKLKALAEKGSFDVDNTSRTTIWYRSEPDQEMVVPFVSRSMLVVINGEEETIDAAEQFCQEMASYYNSKIYKWNHNSVSLPDCRTEDDVIEVAKKVSTNPSFVNAILSRWWQFTDAIFWTDTEADETVLQTETAEDHEKMCQLLNEDEIGRRRGDRETALVPDSVVDVIDRFYKSYSIKDRREPQLARRKILKPLYNNAVEGVSTEFELLGVDVKGAVHVFDRADKVLKVIDDGVVTTTEDSVSFNEEGILSWHDFVEEKRGGWIEWHW